MADIGAFLRFALDQLGAPSDVHRAEFLDAINEAYPPPPPPPPDPAEKDARIAELKAELGTLEG